MSLKDRGALSRVVPLLSPKASCGGGSVSGTCRWPCLRSALVALDLYMSSERCSSLPQMEQTLPFWSECKSPTSERQGKSSEDDERSVRSPISQFTYWCSIACLDQGYAKESATDIADTSCSIEQAVEYTAIYSLVSSCCILFHVIHHAAPSRTICAREETKSDRE
jgi:hypothetical protein